MRTLKFGLAFWDPATTQLVIQMHTTRGDSGERRQRLHRPRWGTTARVDTYKEVHLGLFKKKKKKKKGTHPRQQNK